MIRYLRYLFLIILAVIVITLALANREIVELKLLPVEISDVFGFADKFALPLYLVIFGGILFGLITGFIWEYFREYKYRSVVSKQDRKVVRLEREVDKLRDQTGQRKDDVLALIES